MATRKGDLKNFNIVFTKRYVGLELKSVPIRYGIVHHGKVRYGTAREGS